MTAARIRQLWGAAATIAGLGALLWVLPPWIGGPAQPPAAITPPAPPADPSAHAAALLSYGEIARANVFGPERTPPRSRYAPPGSRLAQAPAAAGEPSLRLFGLAAGAGGAVALIDADPRVPGAEIYRLGDRVGPYRLESIADTFVVLAGPTGTRTLRLQAPQRRSP